MKLYNQLHSKGLNLVAVNDYEKGAPVTNFMKKYKAPFPALINGKGSQNIPKVYGVTGYPTNCVLDSSGTIVWRSEGFDEEGLKGALAKLGLKAGG